MLVLLVPQKNYPIMEGYTINEGTGTAVLL